MDEGGKLSNLANFMWEFARISIVVYKSGGCD